MFGDELRAKKTWTNQQDCDLCLPYRLLDLLTPSATRINALVIPNVYDTLTFEESKVQLKLRQPIDRFLVSMTVT